MRSSIAYDDVISKTHLIELRKKSGSGVTRIYTLAVKRMHTLVCSFRDERVTLNRLIKKCNDLLKMLLRQSSWYVSTRT